MHFLILRPFRKDNIYFRTIEEREKINASKYLNRLSRKTTLEKQRPGQIVLLDEKVRLTNVNKEYMSRAERLQKKAVGSELHFTRVIWKLRSMASQCLNKAY